MLPIELYHGIESAWCPGCGNFGMLKSFKQALAELEIRPVAAFSLSQAEGLDRPPTDM